VNGFFPDSPSDFSPALPFNPEAVKLAGRRKVCHHNLRYFYHRIATCMGHADEIRKGCRRAFTHHLYRSVIQILYVPVHPGSLRAPLDKMTIADTLYPARCNCPDPLHIYPEEQDRL